MLKQNFIFGESLYNPFVVVSTLKDHEKDEWHVILKGGYFFSAYQPVIREIVHKTKDELEALRAHNAFVKKITNNKEKFWKQLSKRVK